MMGIRGNEKAIKTPLPSNSYEQLFDLESSRRIRGKNPESLMSVCFN